MLPFTTSELFTSGARGDFGLCHVPQYTPPCSPHESTFNSVSATPPSRIPRSMSSSSLMSSVSSELTYAVEVGMSISSPTFAGSWANATYDATTSATQMPDQTRTDVIYHDQIPPPHSHTVEPYRNPSISSLFPNLAREDANMADSDWGAYHQDEYARDPEGSKRRDLCTFSEKLGSSLRLPLYTPVVDGAGGEGVRDTTNYNDDGSASSGGLSRMVEERLTVQVNSSGMPVVVTQEAAEALERRNTPWNAIDPVFLRAPGGGWGEVVTVDELESETSCGESESEIGSGDDGEGCGNGNGNGKGKERAEPEGTYCACGKRKRDDGDGVNHRSALDLPWLTPRLRETLERAASKQEWVTQTEPLLAEYAAKQAGPPEGPRVSVKLNEPTQFVMGMLQMLANSSGPDSGSTQSQSTNNHQLLDNFMDVKRWAKEYIRARFGMINIGEEVAVLLTIISNNFYDVHAHLFDAVCIRALENMKERYGSQLDVSDFAFGFDLNMSQEMPFLVEASHRVRDTLEAHRPNAQLAPPQVTDSHVSRYGRQSKMTMQAQAAAEAGLDKLNKAREKNRAAVSANLGHNAANEPSNVVTPVARKVKKRVPSRGGRGGRTSGKPRQERAVSGRQSPTSPMEVDGSTQTTSMSATMDHARQIDLISSVLSAAASSTTPEVDSGDGGHDSPSTPFPESISSEVPGANTPITIPSRGESIVDDSDEVSKEMVQVSTPGGKAMRGRRRIKEGTASPQQQPPYALRKFDLPPAGSTSVQASSTPDVVFPGFAADDGVKTRLSSGGATHAAATATSSDCEGSSAVESTSTRGDVLTSRRQVNAEVMMIMKPKSKRRKMGDC